MSARAKHQADWRNDPRLLKVAAETGYPLDQVHTRGVDFCRRNPRSKAGDFEFDQTIPDFEPVRRVDLEDADGPADFLSKTRLPDGMIDMQRDAELVPKGHTVEGIARYILTEGTQTARVANGEAIPIRLERVPVRGGVSVRGRIGARIVFEVPALSEAEADMRERMHTAMLYAAAHDAAEIIKTEPNYFQRA